MRQSVGTTVQEPGGQCPILVDGTEEAFHERVPHLVQYVKDVESIYTGCPTSLHRSLSRQFVRMTNQMTQADVNAGLLDYFNSFKQHKPAYQARTKAYKPLYFPKAAYREPTINHEPVEQKQAGFPHLVATVKPPYRSLMTGKSLMAEDVMEDAGRMMSGGLGIANAALLRKVQTSVASSNGPVDGFLLCGEYL